MDEHSQSYHQKEATPKPDAALSHQTPPAGPSMQERQKLIQALQEQAVQRANPLQANLGMLTGDVLAVTYFLGQRLKQRLPDLDADGRTSEAFFREADMYLKCVRQTDRLMQMQRQRDPPED